MQARARLAFKLALSLAFLVAVFAFVDTPGLADRLRRLDWVLIVPAMALNMALQVLNAGKIRLLFPRPRPAFAGITAVNFIAVFFTTFVPGGIGGEVARWAYLAGESGSKGRAMGAILMDRITGLWAQVVLVLVAWVWMARGTGLLAMAVPAAILILGLSVWTGLWGYRGVVALVRRLSAWWNMRRNRRPGFPENRGAGGAGDNLAEALETLLSDRPRFLAVAALALGNQLLVLWTFLLLDRSIGGTLAWDQALIVLFFFTVVLLVPLTLGNWGLSEGTLAVLYRYGGAEGGTGVLVSLLFRLMAVPSALIGWVLFLGRSKPVTREESTGTRNQEVFGAEATVRRYASLRDLFPAEKALFDRLDGELRRARLLDLGVGGGRTTGHLASRAAAYLGADYAPAMVEACRARFAGSLAPEAFAVADARKLPAEWAGTFDLILFSYNGLDFLDHGERLAALAEIAKAGKAGSLFIFSSHHLGSVEAALNGRGGGPGHFVDRFFFRILNADLAGKVKGSHAVLRDRGNRARARNYYIRPGAQADQLREAGFDLLEAWPALGAAPFPDLAAASASESRWIYYLARRRAG